MVLLAYENEHVISGRHATSNRESQRPKELRQALDIAEKTETSGLFLEYFVE